MPRRLGSLCVALLLLCLLLPASVSAQAAETEAVARAYETARTGGNLDALLAVFADDAVVTDRLGNRHTGTQEIRRLLRLAGSRGRALAITERVVRGEHVYWVEQAATPDLNFSFAVEAVVRDGRITLLVYRDNGPEVFRGEPAPTGTVLPSALGLALPLFLLTVAIAIFSARPPATTTSTARTLLLAGLREWRQARRPPGASL